MPCPTSEYELIEPFTFTLRTDDPLLIEPQEGFVIEASHTVRILVQDLQLVVRTLEPIEVVETTFSQPLGLHMEITSGTATALGETMDLTGLFATLPIEGYFELADDKLELHITPSSAEFAVSLTEPAQIEGAVILTNAITAVACGTARRLVAEHVDGGLHGQRRMLAEAVSWSSLAPAFQRRLAGGAALVVMVTVVAIAVAAGRRNAPRAPSAAAMDKNLHPAGMEDVAIDIVPRRP